MISPPTSPLGINRVSCRRLTGWVVAILFAALGAGPPDVTKVRVPATGVGRWFPPGSDLRVLPIEEFEALCKAASRHPTGPRNPRLLRARHSARLEANRLIGRSELVVERLDVGGPPLVLLEPWSPAVIPTSADAPRLRVTQEGRLGIKLKGVGTETVQVDWTLNARPGSDGRSFALALPNVSISSIILDVPEDLVPEASNGPRIGPRPGSTPSRNLYAFEEARDRVNLRFLERVTPTDRIDAPRLWLEGTTFVNFSGGVANWRADWTLDGNPGASRTLTIELDPGLEVVDASGPQVVAFRVEPNDVATRLTIRLLGEATGPSPLTIRAICRPPEEGPWLVPSAKPLDANWIGGRTIVRLDPSRSFQSCREFSGRRIPASGELVGPGDLIFEGRGMTGPVAELTLRKASRSATAQIRGHLKLRDEIPRIDVAVSWSVEEGRPSALILDLPAGWTPDSVVTAFRHPAPWHSERLSDGMTRVYLGSPPLDEVSRSVTLTLSATSRRAGIHGPLDLPRVRVRSGTRVVDEIWVASAEAGLSIKPISARGLAWLDPTDPPLDDIPIPWVESDLVGALAWRWLDGSGEGSFDRVQPTQDPRGETRLDASIQMGRLELVWTIEIEPGHEVPTLIPIHLDVDPGTPIRWSLLEGRGESIEARSLDPQRRAILGFPASGMAWDLVPIGPPHERIQLIGRSDTPWSGKGRLPMLTLPPRFQAQGIVSLNVEQTTRVQVESAGLTTLAPTNRQEKAGGNEATAKLISHALRNALRMGYSREGGSLTIETIDGRANIAGLIREATLVSQLSLDSGIHHRLSLLVCSPSATTLVMTMPAGSTIERVRRDGVAILPTNSATGVELEVPPPAPNRPFSAFTIEYHTSGDADSRTLELRRALPDFSLPGQAFSWDLIVPEGWEVSRAEGGLKETDIPRPNSIVSRFLDASWFPWQNKSRRLPDKVIESLLGELDEVVHSIASGDLTLGRWLLRLDSGRWPIVVDRVALRTAGWGPGSRFDVPAQTSGTPRTVAMILQPMKLAAVPLNGLILITGSGQVASVEADPASWSDRLRKVATEENDPTDRFQSVARWRGEPSPRSRSAYESSSGIEMGLARRTWRFASQGWPTADARLTLVDDRREYALVWFVFSIVLGLGWITRGLRASFRGIGIALVGTLATLGLGWSGHQLAPMLLAVVGGCVGVLSLWLGRSVRLSTPSRTSERINRFRLIRPFSMSTHLPMVTMLAFLTGSVIASPFKLADDRPILALLPFDGDPDPAVKPDRVILLVSDYERLVGLALGNKPSTAEEVSLMSVVHRLRLVDPGLAEVLTTLEVEVAGKGPGSWAFPVGMSVELTTEVDDRPVSLAISNDGLTATVEFVGVGVHRVRFRRLVRLATSDASRKQALVPIQPASFALVEIAKGKTPVWVEVAGAAGEISAQGGEIGGILGPIASLDVRWSPDGRAQQAGLTGPVEALFLWDARPFGDRIRMKLAHSDGRGASAIRLSLDPGLVIRRHSIPNVVSIRQGGTPTQPDWLATIDPPLPKDTTVEVEFWRPTSPNKSSRKWPRVEIHSSGLVSTTIGFRRPSDWSGRLETATGGESVSDASFARAWGTFPEAGMTLAGAVKSGNPGPLEVTIAPNSLQRTIRTAVSLEPSPGRLNAIIEATLSDRQGHSFDLEADLPPDFQIARITADGLLRWSREVQGPVHLWLDGTDVRERKVRIEGWTSVMTDPVMIESRTYEAKVPWPGWLDSELVPERIEISSSLRFQVEPAFDAQAIKPPGFSTTDSIFRATYRADPGIRAATIRWISGDSKANVTVDSQLEIDVDKIHWTASMDYEITGGPAESLNLKLPATWARHATIEIEGTPLRLVTPPDKVSGGYTSWKVLPNSPLWGRTRLILRSFQTLEVGQELAFPHVIPLANPGRGSVQRYDVSIGNSSGLLMEVAGSSGLQPIDPSKIKSSRRFNFQSPIRRAFQVSGDRWDLLLKFGRSGKLTSRSSEDEKAVVSTASIDYVVAWDGSTWGKARFVLEPRHGPFLAVDLPAMASIRWASVDGVGMNSLAGGAGHWFFPLGETDHRELIVAWHTPPGSGNPGRANSIEMPKLDRPARLTLVRVDAPDNVIPSMTGAGNVRVSSLAAVLGKIEGLSRTIIDAMTSFDRGSQVERESILAQLEDAEILARQVARIQAASGLVPNLVPGKLAEAFKAIEEAAQSTRSEELISLVRFHVGLNRPTNRLEVGSTMGLPEVIRLRRIGTSHEFQSTGIGEIQFTITKTSLSKSTESSRSAIIATFGSFAWLTSGFFIVVGFRPEGRLAILLMTLSALGLFLAAPIPTLAALGLLGFGWFSAR